MAARRKRGTALWAAVTLAGVAVTLGAVAYGAAPQAPRTHHPGRPARAGRLPRPTITRHPARIETSPRARFALADPKRGLRFECRLDGGGWRPCRAVLAFPKIAPGLHTFSARTVGGRGQHSAATRFRWRLLEPKPLTIASQLPELGALYPGGPPLPLPVTVANPNPVPVFLVSLRVTVLADPAGCASNANLALGPAGATAASPLEVPAGGAVSLPTASVAAPTIALRDLPVNQDACQGARVPLQLTGVARG